MKTIRLLIVLLFVSAGLYSYAQSAPSSFRPDKLKHFVAGAFLTGTVQTIAHEMGCSSGSALLLGFGAGCMGAAAKELYDMAGHGTPSLKDAFWTGLGIGSASVTLRCTLKTRLSGHRATRL